MKKSLLILGVTALVFAGCSNDVLLDDMAIQKDNQMAISFNTFTSKQTRATENNGADYTWHFYNHHDNFQVWGYKNTSETAVFSGDEVTVTQNTANVDGVAATANSYNYTYSPLRYWDKAATAYEFYAAAPSNASWNFVSTGITAADITATGGQNKGYFTTSSTLTPDNLSTASNYDYTNSFKTASDKDKMIAAPKVVEYAQFKTDVQLHFIHILSRLNVTIKKDASLEPNDHKNQQKVEMVSLLVKNLKGTGNFSEQAAADPDGINTRWSTLSNPITYTGVANTEVGTAAKYVIQSLVIPQDAAFESVALDGAQHAATAVVYYADVDEYNAAKGLTGTNAKDESWFTAQKNSADPSAIIKTPAGASVAAVSNSSKPYLVLTYTIQQTHDAAGNPIAAANLKTPEQFVVYYNLANAFGLQTGNLAFNEGWQNTLNITIKPDAINFCADISAWSTTNERGLRVD